MREILFRAKGDTKYNDGDWYYGVPIQCYDGDWQICTDSYKSTVIEDTIGQYTGLTDKNGKKIFDNDIITTSTGRRCLVVWFHSPQYCGWDLQPIEWEHPAPKAWDLYESSNLEVIGNIYDNKELLN